MPLAHPEKFNASTPRAICRIFGFYVLLIGWVKLKTENGKIRLLNLTVLVLENEIDLMCSKFRYNA